MIYCAGYLLEDTDFLSLAICLSYLYLVETMLSAEPIHDGSEADTFSWHQATAIMGIDVSLNLCEAYIITSLTSSYLSPSPKHSSLGYYRAYCPRKRVL